mmetsp:Transcript_71712/g.134120  ORF Transcript_71712/g.134120 Transcript_71712/m.134120 type:complete len:281 (-) Transcript_71712:82-924(-)
MGCGASAGGAASGGDGKMVYVLENQQKGYWDQVIWYGRKSKKSAGSFMEARVEIRDGDFIDPETGDKDWPMDLERVAPNVKSAAECPDELVRAAAAKAWKVEVLHNNNGSNQHDQGHPDDGNQKWMGKTANGEKYSTALNGWHTGWLIRRLKKGHPGKEEPKGKYDCWYEVVTWMCEYGGSPASSLVPHPLGEEVWGGKVHKNLHKCFYGGDAIRPYTGTAEFEDCPIDCSWECNGAAAWHLQGMADLCAARARATGDRAQAAIAAEKANRAQELRDNKN